MPHLYCITGESSAFLLSTPLPVFTYELQCSTPKFFLLPLPSKEGGTSPPACGFGCGHMVSLLRTDGSMLGGWWLCPSWPCACCRGAASVSTSGATLRAHSVCSQCFPKHDSLLQELGATRFQPAPEHLVSLSWQYIPRWN